MNNSALIGVHRFKGYISACTNGSCSVLFGKRNKSTLALFTVIAAIDGKADILALTAVGYQTGQVLDGIQGLAPFADDGADVAALTVVRAALADKNRIAIGQRIQRAHAAKRRIEYALIALHENGK